MKITLIETFDDDFFCAEDVVYEKIQNVLNSSTEFIQLGNSTIKKSNIRKVCCTRASYIHLLLMVYKNDNNIKTEYNKIYKEKTEKRKDPGEYIARRIFRDECSFKEDMYSFLEKKAKAQLSLQSKYI